MQLQAGAPPTQLFTSIEIKDVYVKLDSGRLYKCRNLLPVRINRTNDICTSYEAVRNVVRNVVRKKRRGECQQKIL